MVIHENMHTILCFKKTHLQNCGNPCPKHTKHKLVSPGCSKTTNHEGGRLQKDNLVLIIEKDVQISKPYTLNWVSTTNNEYKKLKSCKKYII
jgi:hypothetical protein